MTDTVLLTGASGFIAKPTILALLDRGYAVRGTVRSAAKGDALKQHLAPHTDALDRLTLVQAELTADAGWAEAAEGCRFVLHMASPFPLQAPKRDEEVIGPARDGTLRVLKAAKAAGVQRVVLTSSFVAVGYGLAGDRPAKPLTEADWTDPDSPDNSAYSRSKTLAEKAAWDYVAGEGAGLELTVINPALVLGPVMAGDPGASVSLVLKMLKGDLPGYPKMGFGVIDVRDVAELHIRALTQPDAAGQRYIASNDFLWMGDMVQILKAHFPKYRRKLPKFPLPNMVVRMAAMTDPDVKSNLFELDKERRLDASKARKTFDWHPRTSEQAIKDCAESLIARGLA